MEKMIYHDRTPILLHPEQANQETREWNQYSHWLRGFLNAKTPVNEQARWRTSSMKQAFSTYYTAPAPGTPWHEVAILETSLFAHADGWAAIGKESQYANLLRARLKNTNE